MSHRVTKCTVCSETGHTRLHCMNVCLSCGCDKRACPCPQPKKRKTAAKPPPQRQEPQDQPAAEEEEEEEVVDYKKCYKQLKKKFEKVSHAYQTMAAQSHRWPHEKRELHEKVGELKKQLEEGDEDNAELEEMLKAKQQHIERLKREQEEHHQEKQQMLVQIEALEEEIRTRTLQAESNHAESAPPAPVVSKNKVAKHNLAQVHERYQQVLQSLQGNHCSIRKAFEIAGISRSTVRDLIGIAELHLVDRECYNVTVRNVMRDSKSSVKNLEVICRSKLGSLLEEMQVMRAENRLLPMSFENNFYRAE